MKLTSTSVWAALLALVAAQSAQPALNNTKDGLLSPHGDIVGPAAVLSFNAVSQTSPIWPLTRQASNQLPHGPTAASGIDVNLVLVKNAATSKTLQPGDIALTSCSASDYTAGEPGFGSLTDVIHDAITANVTAILFYTLDADYCNITDFAPYKGYNSLYTMEGRKLTQTLVNLTSNHSLGFRREDSDTIYSLAAFERVASTQGSPLGLGGAGSTAVAMIILYSITGVITALFLVIIVTGAIRAHRHPERYGPRSVLGRPRQSRAKGIARAMLDTIPIVKFGERDSEEDKDLEGAAVGAGNASTTVRMEDVPTEANQQDSTDREGTETSAGEPEIQRAASSSAVAGTPTKSESDPTNAAEFGTDESLGCSICTDDFEVGQDIRVLPCNHKFHPACVDPWLLDVSGTCPLCRVDLHPATGDGQDAAGSDDLPPPLDPSSAAEGGIGASMRRRDTIRGYVSSRMNRIGMEETSRQERLEMLRRWRETNRAQAAAAPTAQTASSPADGATEEESSREHRLSRFSRIMRRRER